MKISVDVSIQFGCCRTWSNIPSTACPRDETDAYDRTPSNHEVTLELENSER